MFLLEKRINSLMIIVKKVLKPNLIQKLSQGNEITRSRSKTSIKQNPSYLMSNKVIEKGDVFQKFDEQKDVE